MFFFFKKIWIKLPFLYHTETKPIFFLHPFFFLNQIHIPNPPTLSYFNFQLISKIIFPILWTLIMVISFVPLFLLLAPIYWRRRRRCPAMFSWVFSYFWFHLSAMDTSMESTKSRSSNQKWHLQSHRTHLHQTIWAPPWLLKPNLVNNCPVAKSPPHTTPYAMEVLGSSAFSFYGISSWSFHFEHLRRLTKKGVRINLNWHTVTLTQNSQILLFFFFMH